MAALLELDNISMTFRGGGGLLRKTRRVGAVAGVTLKLDAGEILAVVGESGCGKTTLGKMVTGMLPVTGGRILYKGADLRSLRGDAYAAYRRGVQTVHQDSYAALNPARTILQSLSDPILHHKLVPNSRQAHERLQELLTLVGLVPPDQFLDKYPHQLSGGQRQRLLLARALSLQPSLIVADEPVSMVDVSLRISLLDLMSEMNRRFNIAFIYITHDLATARYIASHGRIAVMYPGKVVETGNLSQVMADPRHPYLQALLAAVPIPDPKLARNMPELPLKSLEMPDPSNPPPGCRFHPRCLYAAAICEREEPLLREADGQMVACHEVERIPRWKWESLSSGPS
jgi:peptide/nickel transport system ATP-binding protein